LPHSFVWSDIAGCDVTNGLQLLLRKDGLAFSTTAKSDFCCTMKEEVCYVISNDPNVRKEGSDFDIRTSSGPGGGDSSAKAQYQLPGGQVVNLSNERHSASKVLFQASLIGSEEGAIHDVLLRSMLQSDMDLQ
jgi:centractin